MSGPRALSLGLELLPRVHPGFMCVVSTGCRSQPGFGAQICPLLVDAPYRRCWRVAERIQTSTCCPG